MSNQFLRLIACTAIVIGLGSSVAMGQPAFPADIIDVPPVPPNIEPPAGHSVFLKGHAVGTQNYVCLPAGSAVAWKFVAPQATLYLTFKDEIVQQITTHFLSANPSESGLPRATWQHSFDSSRVWARMVASSTDANFVEAGAIPWFLLAAVGTEAGPTGGARLAQTTYIQRLNTSGGVAPATGCSQSTEIGNLALVPYTADYFFYRSDRRR